jgi:hypothetical protein
MPRLLEPNALPRAEKLICVAACATRLSIAEASQTPKVHLPSNASMQPASAQHRVGESHHCRARRAICSCSPPLADPTPPDLTTTVMSNLKLHNRTHPPTASSLFSYAEQIDKAPARFVRRTYRAVRLSIETALLPVLFISRIRQARISSHFPFWYLMSPAAYVPHGYFRKFTEPRQELPRSSFAMIRLTQHSDCQNRACFPDCCQVSPLHIFLSTRLRAFLG